MNTRLDYNPAFSRSRWVGYFDLLGTRELIRSGDHFRVFSVYETAVGEVIRWNSRLTGIQHAWFSDTFLIYSEDDTASDFVAMDSICRWFVHFLILAGIPVRGAVACGDFYADAGNRVYLGQALLDAYEFGEAQDWIGFLLCPSAIMRLDEVGLPASEQLNYSYAEVPFKKMMSTNRLAACVLGEWAKINGENQVVVALRQMKARQLDGEIARKYQNFITFIERHGRHLSQGNQPGAAPKSDPDTQLGSSGVMMGPASLS